MSQKTLINTEALSQSATATTFEKLLRKMFLSKVAPITRGHLIVEDQLATTLIGEIGKGFPQAKIVINDLRFYRLVALRGALGAAEAFILGYWCSDTLVEVIRIMALNKEIMAGFEKGLARLQRPAAFLIDHLTRNTLRGSRKNISAHYDLSNELFHLFLDSNMMYSGAYYENESTTLDQAALAKLERICRKISIKPSDHILEIGTGWGGFAIYAANKYGCKVTTTTISEQQYSYTQRLIVEMGLEERVTVLLKDYRELSGKYDKIVSIEMIEAVGADFLNRYLASCSHLLKDDGCFSLQAITINDQNYKSALGEIDFIKKYIFPGSFIPSINAIVNSATVATDLRLYHLEDITPHYARTLLDWRQKFLSRKKEILALGFDDAFIKMWDYYFCYCAGGFIERAIGNVQLIFGKPLYRQDLSIKTNYL